MDKKNSANPSVAWLSGFMEDRRRGWTIFLALGLCGSIVISGCTTTSALGRLDDQGGGLPPDRNLTFTFRDGTTIEAGPYGYAEVREPGDFLCGRGARVSKATGRTAGFEGRIVPLSFDQTGGYNTYSISDTEYVRFRQGDYVVVRKSDGAGLFVATRNPGGAAGQPHTVKKPFDDILQIEETTISVWKTALLGAGILAIVLTVAVASSFSSFQLGSGRGAGPRGD